MAKAFGDGQEGFWEAPSSCVHSESGKHKELQVGEVSSPETPAAVSAALLTFYLQCFFETPWSHEVFSLPSPSPEHASWRKILSFRGFFLPPGLSLGLPHPQAQPWWTVGRCFREWDDTLLCISFHFPQLEFIAVFIHHPRSFPLVLPHSVLQFLCPRKSCRDLTKLPEQSCLMPLELSTQG